MNTQTAQQLIDTLYNYAERYERYARYDTWDASSTLAIIELCHHWSKLADMLVLWCIFEG